MDSACKLSDLLTLRCSSQAAEDPAASFQELVVEGLDRPPLPGAGDTLERWRCLAAVAAVDLVLAKFYEGHTDAIAILAELGAEALIRPGQRWAVWAADPPHARPMLCGDPTGYTLTGKKSWCSGAAFVTHALITAYCGSEGPYLVVLPMDQPGVRVNADGWSAVGMGASGSVDVFFTDAVIDVLGGPGDYLRRRGFWHGGAGIAACWFGGALGLAQALRSSLEQRSDAVAAAHLGHVDVSLQGCAALLREGAAAIDRDPLADSQVTALRCRGAAEATAEEVLHHVGRAMGATPFCRVSSFARRAADLPVFVRQSHGERDLAALGVALHASPAWIL